MSAIFERISIRKYEKKSVSDEMIKKIIEAGCAAPSAGNQQPWQFYVVKNNEILEKLSHVHQWAGPVAEADFAIVPCYKNEGLWAQEFAHVDMAACTENMPLEITELGLGAVWIGIAPDEARTKLVNDILSLPKDLSSFAIIPVGYPAESHAQESRYDEARIHFI